MKSRTASVHISSSGFLIREGIKELVTSVPGYQCIESQDDDPDLIIYEYDKLDKHSFDTVAQMLSRTNVLLITGSLDKREIQHVINLGVRSVVTSRCSKEEIINAMNTAIRGDRFMCSRVLDILMQEDIAEPASVKSSQVLSPREKEVLTLITQGNTTIQIADLLHVSVHTINSHRKNMLKKFNLKSPIELIVYALENDLVEK